MERLLKNCEWEKYMALAEEFVTTALCQKKFGLIHQKSNGLTITAIIKPIKRQRSVEDIMELLNLDMKPQPKATKRSADEEIGSTSTKLAKMSDVSASGCTMGTDMTNIEDEISMDMLTKAIGIDGIENDDIEAQIESTERALKRQSNTDTEAAEAKKLKTKA